MDNVTVVPSSSPRFVSASIKPESRFVYPFFEKNSESSFPTIFDFSHTLKSFESMVPDCFSDVKTSLFHIFLSIYKSYPPDFGVFHEIHQGIFVKSVDFFRKHVRINRRADVVHR